MGLKRSVDLRQFSQAFITIARESIFPCRINKHQPHDDLDAVKSYIWTMRMSWLPGIKVSHSFPFHATQPL